jgi:hypothetical protein
MIYETLSETLTFFICFVLHCRSSNVEWRESGKRGRYARLMTEEELPKFVTQQKTIELDTPLGKGARARGPVAYGDSLTEKEFQRVIDSGYGVRECLLCYAVSAY